MPLDGSTPTRNGILMSYYTYYSYEPFGRGYIGYRQCTCLPEEDVYFGSFTDSNFHPTEKIILSTYETKEEALEDEVKLHSFYQVDKNPHFANKAKQTSSRFSFCSNGERKGKGNPTYGKVRITNGTEERVVFENEIPIGWKRGRSERTKILSHNHNTFVKWGDMYETFISDIEKDRSILEISLRTLAKRYNTSHTSIKRWKSSVVHPLKGRKS
jgi:hypothetical protein